MASRTIIVLTMVAMLASLAGCGSDSSPPSSPPPNTDAGELALVVSPPEEPPEVRAAIPGQRVSFLVEVEGVAGPVTIAATADQAVVEQIVPVELSAGTVGEVWVVPDPATEETTATVEITATLGDDTVAEVRTIPIIPMAGERAADAEPYFDLWTEWLAAEHPELGITEATVWDPEYVSTLLVVSHYAYFSEDWEMTIAWHVMIPPSDWTEVYLRRRGVDAAPSLAYKIDSVAEGTEPHEIEPPEVVVR
ncbi:MAG: hypothetical protein R6X29_04460 [Acidimicrobiia bacterium]